MESNPYAPPQANLHHETEAEVIRKDHLGTEGNIQAIGGLLTIGSTVALIAVAASSVSLFTAENVTFKEWLITAGIMIICALQLAVGLSLRKLKPGARWPATIITALGLLGFPIGTVISLYFLYVLNNKRGRFILSPDYQAIRDATPHIKRKTSLAVIILLAILVLILVGVVAAIVMDK